MEPSASYHPALEHDDLHSAHHHTQVTRNQVIACYPGQLTQNQPHQNHPPHQNRPPHQNQVPQHQARQNQAHQHLHEAHQNQALACYQGKAPRWDPTAAARYSLSPRSRPNPVAEREPLTAARHHSGRCNGAPDAYLATNLQRAPAMRSSTRPGPIPGAQRDLQRAREHLSHGAPEAYLRGKQNSQEAPLAQRAGSSSSSNSRSISRRRRLRRGAPRCGTWSESLVPREPLSCGAGFATQEHLGGPAHRQETFQTPPHDCHVAGPSRSTSACPVPASPAPSASCPASWLRSSSFGAPETPSHMGSAERVMNEEMECRFRRSSSTGAVSRGQVSFASTEDSNSSCPCPEDIELRALTQRLQLYKSLRQRAAKECEIFTQMLEEFLVNQ